MKLIIIFFLCFSNYLVSMLPSKPAYSHHEMFDTVKINERYFFKCCYCNRLFQSSAEAILHTKNSTNMQQIPPNEVVSKKK